MIDAALITFGFLFLTGSSYFIFWISPALLGSTLGMIGLFILALPVFLLWFFSIRAVLLNPRTLKERQQFYSELANSLDPIEASVGVRRTTCKAVIDGIECEYGNDNELVLRSINSDGPVGTPSFYFFVRTGVASAGHLALTTPLTAGRSYKRFNNLGMQINTGVPATDEHFYVFSDMPEFTRSFMNSSVRQHALADLRTLSSGFEVQIILKDKILELRITLKGDSYSLDLSKMDSCLVVGFAKILKSLATDIPHVDTQSAGILIGDRKAPFEAVEQVNSSVPEGGEGMAAWKKWLGAALLIICATAGYSELGPLGLVIGPVVGAILFFFSF